MMLNSPDLSSMFDPPGVRRLRGELLEMVRVARAENHRGVTRRQWALVAETIADEALGKGLNDAAGEHYAIARKYHGQADARFLVARKHLAWAKRRRREINEAIGEDVRCHVCGRFTPCPVHGDAHAH